MNYSVFSQKIYNALVRAYKLYLTTPERSLEEAYQAALKIKEIEEQHFSGNKIDSNSNTYTSSVIDYFKLDLKKQLRIVRMRLTEFKASRFFLNESNQKAAERFNIQRLDPSLVLEKLKFIDDITAKYTTSNDEIATFNDLAINDPNITNVAVQPAALQRRSPNLVNKISNNVVPSKSDGTNVLPRSIFSTINRLQVELDPNAEKNVVQNFRQAQRRTVVSVRFLLLLIIVPVLTHQLSKPLVVGPVVEHFRGSSEEAGLFLNYEMEEEALSELQKFEERIKFENLIKSGEPLSAEEIEHQLQEKVHEIAEEYRDSGTNAIKNVFADILAVGAFSLVLLVSQREIVMLKNFFDNILYGLSDSAKAFVIILFTDMFVGFHSPHGWEVLLEGISRHWGLPANHNFIFLFIATFPVILDTIFKYWIFRYLNRISPSAVATYRNMNE
jgi:rRNA maturation endonuclease Nob1